MTWHPPALQQNALAETDVVEVPGMSEDEATEQQQLRRAEMVKEVADAMKILNAR